MFKEWKAWKAWYMMGGLLIATHLVRNLPQSAIYTILGIYGLYSLVLFSISIVYHFLDNDEYGDIDS